MTAQLFPREPRRMKQPRKDALRDQLVIAADRIIELATENQRLRAAIEHTTTELSGALAPKEATPCN